MIYLDNAATTFHKPECVIEAVVNALKSVGNSGRGTHEVSLGAARIIFEARTKLANFFNVGKPAQVAFTSNSTEALNTAIFGLAEDGSEIITTDLEHNSVLRPLYKLESMGKVKLRFVKADKRGCIDYGDFEKLITDKTRLIVTTHASNLTGNLLDIKKIAGIAHNAGLHYIVDASQTAGSIPIDMQDTGVDVLCFTGHKSLMGPQGTGGICVKEGIEISPLKTGGTGVQSYSKTQPLEMPVRLEAGTLNTHGIAGLSAAIDFINHTGIEAIHNKETSLMKRLYDGLLNIEGVKIYGDFSTIERMPIVAFNIKDEESGVISDILAQDFDIASRPGAHCAPLMHESLCTVSQGAVRFSVSYFNTEDEIDAAIEAVKTISENL